MHIARMLSVVALAAAASLAPAAAAQASDTTYVAQLSASQEVPTNDSLARGATVLKVVDGGESIEFRLIVANLRNPVAAHIHAAPAGANGPVVAFLHGPGAPGSGRTSGVLSTGTITSADLVGPLAGQSLDALIDLLETGGAYVNVHTNDGVAPATGEPGDIPSGEIRGQIR
ncbi:CHRD domain-containing protein [Agromyces marinus]|uniref:CHRD domain-containing protein n=1 Tax=Agromyces marinus TaxID=1389020 RepID=A0ABN6Y9H1_9MICO|nr:CHRD domain-containing protein [Agromyces marinus]UIP57966.1 hypothetical protein DSM26151_08350 [Agromyces marinus]BDZ53831.1 CHRD domain-containing protein [Agromyces marinus]